MLGKALTYLLLLACSAVFMLPFLFMLTTALKSSAAVLTIPPKIFPSVYHWENFGDAMRMMRFWKLLGNTMTITGLTIAGTLLSCTLVAFGFARFDFKGRSFWFLVLISTMLIPGQITMIPLYLLMKWLGWIDTIKPLTVPAFFGTAFYIFLLRQFFMTVPRELDEAAIIDGCGPMRLLLKIMLPLIRPALATVTIFTFMHTWNDFLGPLIYLQSDNMRTLSLGLYSFQGEYVSQWHYLMAASILLMLPCLLVFFFFQRYFIEGTTVTGIKG
ncbi:carbohydrate ABC transporter permease [Cohnella sp. CBP 2801]|uniref:Carbohydrate ABC transporter permease n=1 Tax=Cohnella zeiphila TaxID=2761120 RepID=A0A7X0VWS9_9BACL|nr:carbohydrate ABC transporter permease [Cohnella zeiphila]